jgi:CheY-like chemotaxis protein
MHDRKVSLIFVVDDEPAIAKSLAVILQHRGYVTRFFTNPLDALADAKVQAPDLLISDIVMPQLSGVDLAIQLKELHPNCRILLFSGQACTNDLLEQARLVGHEFTLLPKPVHPADLFLEIDRFQDGPSDPEVTSPARVADRIV